VNRAFVGAALRGGLACGVIAPLWWGAMILWCASVTPGYSHVTDFISELAARGAPTAALMQHSGFALTGALYLVFAAAAGWQQRREPFALTAAVLLGLAGGARILAGLHPCEAGCDAYIISRDQVLHHRYASAGYLLMMTAALAWGAAGLRLSGLGHLLSWGLGVTTWCAVFLVMMLSDAAHAGLFQRLASGVLSLWAIVLAVSLWRVEAAKLAPAPVPPPKPARRRQRRGAGC
jgi:hypothetical membrane protein